MRPVWLHGLLATTAIGVAAPAPALAQAVDSQSTAKQVGELIVTARKREETLQDVPVAGTVLSGESIREVVVDKSADLVNQLPATSLVISGAEYTSDISMRGQGIGRLGTAESSTGIYRNGIFIAGGQFGGRTFSRMDLFDVDRVESFRGPQGALYGRNAVGGSVNVISARPTQKFEVRASGQYRFETESRQGELIANLPVNANVAVRLATVFDHSSDGHYENLATGKAVDQSDFQGYRGSMLARTGGGGELYLSLEGFKNKPPTLVDIGYVPDSGDPDPYERRNLKSDSMARIREWASYAEYRQPLPFADLSLVGMYKERVGQRLNEDTLHLNGLGGRPADVRGSQSADFLRWGLEARLASNATDSRWQWLVGADAQGLNDRSRVTQTLIFNNLPTAQQRAVVNALPNDRLTTDHLSSWSVFGLVGYDVSDRLNITAELRSQKDDKRQRGFDYRTLRSYDVSQKFDEVTPVLTATYELNSTSRVYARYATGYRPGGFNDVYLFGGLTIPGTRYDAEYTKSYEVGWKGRLFDNALYVEAAAFLADTDNVQLVTRDPASGTTQAALLNAGTSEIYGYELSAQGGWRMGPGRLGVNASVSGQWGDFGKGSSIINNQGNIDLSGKRVPRTRDYMANLTLSYSTPLTRDLRWTVLGNWRAEGGGFENLAGSAGLAAGRKLEDFDIVNLRTVIAYKNWRASLFVKNAFDERYAAQAISILSAGAAFGAGNAGYVFIYNEPRTTGLELSVRY